MTVRGRRNVVISMSKEPASSMGELDLKEPATAAVLVEGAPGPALESAEMLVGLLTLNNAGTIESIVKAVVEGLRESFGEMSAMIVNCDAGSQDGTPVVIDRVAGVRIPVWMIRNAMNPYTNSSVESGFPERDESVRNLFAAARRLQSKACLILDGHFRSVPPRWIDQLGSPILDDGQDLVVALYQRPRYEGILVSNLLYPLTRALYGKRLQYLSGGAYGLSGKLAVDLLTEQERWGREAKYSLDGWITTSALAGEYRACHAYLGTRDQDMRLGTTDLAVLMVQTVGAVFRSMETHERTWERVTHSTPVPQYGTAEPVPLHGPVQVGRMVNGFKQGLRDLLPLWELILSRETLEQVLTLGTQDFDDFRFPPDLWVQTVYDFALAYHDQTLHREHVLKSLTPLYLGRMASFVLETQDSDTEVVDRTVETLCRRFEQMKGYIIERWRWRDERSLA